VQKQVYRNVFDCRAFAPGQCTSPQPAAGSEVAVVDGQGAGMRTAPDANGKYRLEVPTGPIRLKFSLVGYDDEFTSTYAIDQSAVVTVPQITLRMSAWPVSGLVTDSGGKPLAGADIELIDYGDFVIGRATTDTSGRYRYTPSYGSPHPAQFGVSAHKAGYEVGYSALISCCNIGSDTVVNLQIGARILTP
jgi:hypothetical protein